MNKQKLHNYHQYKLVDIKNGTNFYNKFIKNKKNNKNTKLTNKITKKIKLKSLFGGDIAVKEYEDETGIFVGKNGKCVFGQIDKYQPDTMIIQNFSYYNDCNTIKQFEKGKDMKRLMETMIRFIKENYPEIKQLLLSDEATLLCESKINNRIYNIYLPKLYFLKYGMGYYQYNFGFQLIDKEFDATLQDNKIIFSKFELKKKEFIKNLEKKNIIHIPEIQRDLTTLFNGKNKLNSIEISKQLELHYDCIFLYILINYIYAKTEIEDIMGASYALKL